MRTSTFVEAATVGVLVSMGYATLRALYGPHALPSKVPVHFNAAGQPDGWGSPQGLWILVVIAVLVYGLMTLVARFPSAFNFPVRVTPANRASLEIIALRMILWLKIEIVLLFVFLQGEVIRFMRQGHGTLSPLYMPIGLAIILGTVAWHVIAIFRTGQGYAGETRRRWKEAKGYYRTHRAASAPSECKVARF